MLAVPKIDPANWTPFLPYGFQGVMAGAAIIVTAFLGFDATSTTAEESRDPGRDIPVRIISSLLICTALYTIVALLLTGLVPYTQLNNTGEPLDPK